MTKVCITGGSGFIGQHLARALPGATLFDFPKHNLTNLADACAFVHEWKPEVIYHLAAQAVVTNEDDFETMETNVRGTYNLYHACLGQKQIRSIVHISTDKVYGTNANARRTDPLRGVSEPYSASKHCGDIIAQSYKNFHNLPIHIVRTGNIYGPGDLHFDRIIPGTIRDTLAGRRRYHRGDRRWIRDFIYIDDLIPAYLRIAEEKPGIFNLGGEYSSLADLVDKILRLMGREDLPPLWGNSQHNEIPFQHVVDCPEWWKPATSLESGLLKTIEWHKSRQ